jgi:dihydroxy-acid dehydratase
VFDVPKRELRVELSDVQLKERMREWRAPEPRYTTGVMAKYAKQVSSAALGAVTI